MLGFSSIAQTPIAALPQTGATDFPVTVDAGIDASVAAVSFVVGKIVSAGIDVAATFGNFAISKIVTAAVDVATQIVKAATASVSVAADAAGAVLKDAGKVVSAGFVVSVTITMTQDFVVMVNAGIDVAVRFLRVFSGVRKPFFRRSANTLWKGRS